MSVAGYLRHGIRLMTPLAIACTIYLYLYPVFSGCAFPLPSRDPAEAFEVTKKMHWPYAGGEGLEDLPTKLAPFRLLALGDPQLEGDTSIPTIYFGFMPHLKEIFKHVTFQTEHWCFRERIRMTLHDTVDLLMEDIPNIFESIRKRFDLFGNDFYLAHIYRTLHWWTNPTHVSVLGDLLGSQWIEDDEFERRGRRFWNRSFKGGERVPDEVAAFPDHEYELSGVLDGSGEQDVWKRRIINVAGNHDIGYAGDLTEERMERFERIFGKANYNLHFELPISDPEVNATILNDETNPDSNRLAPEIRIVVVNDMNLDTPAKDTAMQDATYNFINKVIGTSAAVEYKGIFTLVLTHIPMYKPEGVCVDAPYFEFHTPEDGGGVKEQYLLSGDASRGFLEGMFGVSKDTNAPGNGQGRHGLILDGHDHAGCDTFHFVNHTNGTSNDDRPWQTVKWADAQAQGLPLQPWLPGRREITVRSMMGDFGGNAGLLSMWFDQDEWEWRYEYVDCPLGRQHFWWLTHLLDFGVVLCVVLYGVVGVLVSRGVDVDGHAEKAVTWVRQWIAEARRKGIVAAVKSVTNGTPKKDLPKKDLPKKDLDKERIR